MPNVTKLEYFMLGSAVCFFFQTSCNKAAVEEHPHRMGSEESTDSSRDSDSRSATIPETKTDTETNTDAYCGRFVDLNANKGGDGQSWSTAFTSVREAIDATNEDASICEIWVAAGTYYIYQTSPNDTLQLKGNMHLYGGFKGNEKVINERDWAANQTILDGHDKLNGTKQVYSVVMGNQDAVLDGFVVTGAKANVADESGFSGAMSNLSAIRCEVRNCIFKNNDTNGMFNQGYVSVKNSLFFNNNGFGMHYAFPEDNAPITNCTFANNAKAGIFIGQGTSDYWPNNLPPYIDPDDFYGDSDGPCNPSYEDVYYAKVTNSIVWGNNTRLEDSEADIRVNGICVSADIRNCAFRRDDPRWFDDYTGNIDLDPMFVDAGSSDFHLNPNSPCIDAANEQVAPALDLDGHPRYDDPNTPNSGYNNLNYVDMGAYEYQGSFDPPNTDAGAALRP